jgi:hypothetical protein
MNALDWGCLLGAVGMTALVLTAVLLLLRRQAAPVRASPDLEFVLRELARERTDFRTDLEASTQYHMAHAEQLRADAASRDKLMLGLMEDVRAQNSALFSALLQRSLQPGSSPPADIDAPADVMDDEREAELERLRRADNGVDVLPQGAQNLVDMALKNIRGGTS